MGTSTASLIVASCAVVVAIASFLYTQWHTDSRERDKWRREELLQLSSGLLQLSHRRQQDLIDDLDRLYGSLPSSREDFDVFGSVNQMSLLVEEIRLLDDDLADAAEVVHQLHQEAVRKYEPTPDSMEVIETLMVEPAELKQAHGALISRFRASTKLPAPKV